MVCLGLAASAHTSRAATSTPPSTDRPWLAEEAARLRRIASLAFWATLWGRHGPAFPLHQGQRALLFPGHGYTIHCIQIPPDENGPTGFCLDFLRQKKHAYFGDIAHSSRCIFLTFGVWVAVILHATAFGTGTYTISFVLRPGS